MLNVYLFTNKREVTKNDLPIYLARFHDIMPPGYIEGKGFFNEFNSTEYFHRGFFHIRNEVQELKNRFFVLVDLDFSKYPEVEGYIEHRVFPFLKEELNKTQDVFDLHMVERVQREDAALYIFEGNGAAFNEAIARVVRGSMKAVD